MNWKTFLIAAVAVAIAGTAALIGLHRQTIPDPASTLPSNQVSGKSLGTLITEANYRCDGDKKIGARYYRGEDQVAVAAGEPPVPNSSVALTFSDGFPMTLHQTISADGARYANVDESFVFWSKGNGAMVLQDGKEKDYTNCISATQQVPAATSTP